jgi:hypothetical protein
MVTVPEILAAMRDVIAAVDGVNAAHYPAPKTIKQGPDVVLYWGTPNAETTISMDLNQRMWQPAIMARVLTPMTGNTEAEFARIDNLIMAIVDAFDAGTTTQVMPSLNGAVNRCQVTNVRSTLQAGFAGHDYYAAELDFSVKFHRRTP